MILFILTALLVISAGAAGFLAGVKHADKARLIKDAIKR